RIRLLRYRDFRLRGSLGDPVANVGGLRTSFRDPVPALGAQRLLPDAIQLFQRRVPGEPSLDEHAPDYGPGASDAGPAMDVHLAPRTQRIAHAVEDLAHVLGQLRQTVVLDGLAQVLDADGKGDVVRRRLTGEGQIDEALDAGGQQPAETHPRLLR